MDRRTRGLVVWFALAACLLASPSGVSAQSQLRRSERTELARGHLVTRPASRTVGRLRLFGGTSYQVIEASPDRVFSAMLDTRNYTQFLPQVVEARVAREDRAAHRRNVFIVHRRGVVEASYNVEITYWPARRHLEFRLDKTRPRSIREAWGFAHVAPYRGGRSLVTFGAMADIGGGIVGAAFRSRVHRWMLRVPRMLRQLIAESDRPARGPA